jgi:hypothetical protein
MAGARYPPKWKTPFMPAGAAALNSFAARFARQPIPAPKRRKPISRSFPRKRESRQFSDAAVVHWVPAFAGTNGS